MARSFMDRLFGDRYDEDTLKKRRRARDWDEDYDEDEEPKKETKKVKTEDERKEETKEERKPDASKTPPTPPAPEKPAEKKPEAPVEPPVETPKPAANQNLFLELMRDARTARRKIAEARPSARVFWIGKKPYSFEEYERIAGEAPDETKAKYYFYDSKTHKVDVEKPASREDWELYSFQSDPFYEHLK